MRIIGGVNIYGNLDYCQDIDSLENISMENVNVNVNVNVNAIGS